MQFQSSSRTLLGTTFAVLLGAYFVKRITIYPGGHTPFYVIPAFASAFAMVIMLFFFVRIDYSRIQFLLSFLFAVVFFFLVVRVERKALRQRYLVLPFGAAPALADLEGADWDIAPAPDAALDGFSGVAADLRADMPAEWSGSSPTLRFAAFRFITGSSLPRRSPVGSRSITSPRTISARCCRRRFGCGSSASVTSA